MTPDPADRARWLARAGRDELVALADACLADGVEPRVVLAPEIGTLATQVREPVARTRFLVGDVLACRAEALVVICGHCLPYPQAPPAPHYPQDSVFRKAFRGTSLGLWPAKRNHM